MPHLRSRPVILVIDDDEAVREVLHLMLGEQYEVLDAADGESGLALIRKADIHLVLLDLLMSGLDGLQVLEEIQAAPRHIPVIVVSAINTAWTATAAMRLGAVDYLTKPFAGPELLAAIRAGLSPPPAASALRKHGDRIPILLLVGFDLGTRASLAVTLTARCRVETVAGLSQALAYLKTNSPDLIAIEISENALRIHADPAARIRAAFPTGPILVIDTTGEMPSRQGHTERGLLTLLRRPASLMELLHEVDSNLPRTTPALPPFGHLTARVIDYAWEKYAEATIEELGKAMGIAPYYLSRLFRRETGMLLKSYLNMLRVEAAKLLLVETTDNIDVIASRVGMHDASHLSRVFQALTGKRPGTYRKTEGQTLRAVFDTGKRPSNA